MKRLNGAGVRALDTIKQFTVAQRTIAIIGVAVLLLGGIALASQLTKPTYQVLYSGISASEASGVTAQLTKDKVLYTLSSDGTTIFVPEASVAQERLATASLLSSGAGGYSLLDNMGVTVSEFQQNVTYKRAIEGELAQTIESINGVSSAVVLLAIPQQTVFTDDKQNPTASVTVNASTPLTTDQVNAIVDLVAAAYPGLTADNVNVVDQKGDVLASVGSGTTGSGSDAAADYEATTKATVQAMLDRVLGPGNAVVTVAADVSSSSGKKTSETYSNANAPLSESSISTSNGTSGTSTGASGVLGTDTTNGTSTGGTSSAAGTGMGTVTQSAKDNAVNKTTIDQTIVPGTLNRQTIAVALNSKILPTTSATAVQTMVTNAAGVNAARGDTISVTSVPFSTSAATSAAAALAQSAKAQSAGQMTELITTAIKVVGGLVLFVLVVGLLRKLFKRPEGSALDAGAMNIVPMPGDPMYGGYPQTAQLGGYGPAGALGAPMPGAAPTVALNAPVNPEFAQMQADVDALAGSNPEQTAEYLRALMGDRAGV